MDKLFDLMVMGAKYSLVCSAKLEDMVEVLIAGRHGLLAGFEAHVCKSPKCLVLQLYHSLPECVVPLGY